MSEGPWGYTFLISNIMASSEEINHRKPGEVAESATHDDSVELEKPKQVFSWNRNTSLEGIKNLIKSPEYLSLVSQKEPGKFYVILTEYIVALDNEAINLAKAIDNSDYSDKEAQAYYAYLRELASEELLIPENASEAQKMYITTQILSGILQRIEDKRISTNDLGVAQILMETYWLDFVSRLHPSFLISAGTTAAWSREMDKTKSNTEIIGILKDSYARLLLIGLIQDQNLNSFREVFLKEHESKESFVETVRILESVRQLMDSSLPYQYPLEFESLLHDATEFTNWAEPGCNGYILHYALQELRRAIKQADDVLMGDADSDDPDYAIQFEQNEEFFEDYPQYVSLFESLMEEHQKDYLFAPLSKEYIGVHTNKGKFAGALAISDLRAGELHFNHLSDLNIYSAENLKTDEERNEMTYDLRTMLSIPFMQRIEENLGLAYSELGLREINYLYNFIKYLDSNQVAALAADIDKFDIALVTTLLSTEHGSEMGLAVSKIARYFSYEGASQVFNKYTELVNVADGVRRYLHENYGEELAAKPGLEEAIVQNLLKRGKDLLQKAAQEGIDETTILKELEHSKGDLLLFANAFRGMYGREVSLDQFKELSIEHTAGGQLNQEEYDQMLVMADQNWDDLKKLMPQMYGQIMHDVPAQLKGEDSKTGGPIDTTWHVMKRNNTVLGYFRLDNTASNTVYFGSMNSLPDLHGFKLGDAILKDMLAKETEGKLIEAHASPKTAICRSYINKYGFVGTGLLSYYDTGEQLLALEEDKRGVKPHMYVLKNKGVGELLVLNGKNGVEVAEYLFAEDFKNEAYKRFLEDAQKHFDNGKVLSAFHVTDEYRADEPDSKKLRKYVFGFEPKGITTLTEEPSPK